MFAGYIFDVEGTLVDSVPHLRSRQEALELAGIGLPYAALQLYSALDGNQTLQIIAPDLDETRRKQILQDEAHIYDSIFTASKRSVGSVSSPTVAAGSLLRLTARDLSSSITCPSFTSMSLSRPPPAATMSNMGNRTRASWVSRG